MGTAKLAIDPATNRPVIVYRIRPVVGARWQIRIASWTGSSWQRATVYAGAYSTYATEDVSISGGVVRAYYVKATRGSNDQAFVATKQPGGSWVGDGSAEGRSGRAVGSDPGETADLLYLAAPLARTLYVGTLAW